MLVQGTIPITEVELSTITTSPAEAVAAFKKQHPTARVESVEGVLIRGICRCGNPVFETTKNYRFDAKREIYVCPECITKPKEIV